MSHSFPGRDDVYKCVSACVNACLCLRVSMQTPTMHGRAEERRGRGGHAGFNQSLQPIELQCVLVQWPTPD